MKRRKTRKTKFSVVRGTSVVGLFSIREINITGAEQNIWVGVEVFLALDIFQ